MRRSSSILSSLRQLGSSCSNNGSANIGIAKKYRRPCANASTEEEAIYSELVWNLSRLYVFGSGRSLVRSWGSSGIRGVHT